MEETTKIFLEQGLMGAIVVILIGVVVFMQKRADKKDQAITELHEKLIVISDKWRESETERSNRLMEIASTGNSVQAALVEKIQLGREQR